MSEERAFDAEFVASIYSGRLLALEYAVQLLIMSHPDRELLRARWHAMLPEQLDAWLLEPGYAVNDVFRRTLHAQLSRLGEFLDVDPDGDEETQ